MGRTNQQWHNARLLILTIAGLIMGLTWFIVSRATPIQAQSPGVRGPFVGQTIRPRSFDGDLRQLPTVTPSRQPTVFPLRGRGNPVVPGSPKIFSGFTQSPLAPSAMPTPLRNFDGVSFTFAGWPPDPNGDVSPNHYVQSVNVSFAVYDKTGTTLVSPRTFDTLWGGANTGTPCDNQNRGDPIVLYDQLADRWLISDFAFAADIITGDPVPPFYECIAISKTNNPVSGGWDLYPLLGDNNLFNDYPKFGLWNDAYYMTANMYNLSTNDVFVRVWALDRNAMVAGTMPTPIHFDLPTCLASDSVCPYISLLPSNLRGSLPPSGSANYLANIEAANTSAGLPFSSTVIHLWKFHVDWTTPLSSTLTGPTNLTVPSFTEPLIGSGGTVAMNLVPQKGTTNMLDTIGDRLMMQAQYRNLPAAEGQSLWLAHTINSGNVTGIRWYQVGISGGSFSLKQQGTFDPDDGNFRWLPSLAVDGNGNMAVGYSVSSSTINPGIRYTGRLSTDSPNQLAQGEATLRDGAGSQTQFFFPPPITRWGDYSAMTIDPSDDCTFWYTNEYYASDGFIWLTRIGSFKMPSCTPPRRSIFLPLILK